MSEADEAYAEALRRIVKAAQNATDSLYLADLDNLDRLPPEISELGHVESIQLGGIKHGTRIANLQPLIGLPSLTHLSLMKCKAVDFGTLVALPQLLYLDLWASNIIDLSPLVALPRLETLILTRTAVVDFQPLADMKSLTYLQLSDCKITDLTPFTALSELRVLRLDNTPVTDLRPLRTLRNLEVLNFSYTRVTDVSALSELRHLKSLRLSRTPVSDLAPLMGLSQLTHLTLDGTAVVDLRPIANLPLGEGDGGPLENGLTFLSAPAVMTDPELERLATPGDDGARARATRTYLKTLPPWPEPLGMDLTARPTEASQSIRTAETTIAFLLAHASTTQVSAAGLASQIRFALRDVPATNGNRLPSVLQSMEDIAVVLEGLGAAVEQPERQTRETRLLEQIARLEDKLKELTERLMDAEQVREAANALETSPGFWKVFGTSFAKASGTASGAGIIALAGFAAPTALVYFLGQENPLVQTLLTVLGRLRS